MGITGGVGSGKSRVLEILKEEYGFRVIQADQVAKDLMQPGQESYRAVVDFLGPVSYTHLMTAQTASVAIRCQK